MTSITFFNDWRYNHYAVHAIMEFPGTAIALVMTTYLIFQYKIHLDLHNKVFAIFHHGGDISKNLFHTEISDNTEIT